MAKYFCSDFHFGHLKMVRIERDECASIEEHDDKILLGLSKLNESDELYFLGDFGELNNEKALLFKGLRCKKYMLPGNHDSLSASFYQKRYGFDIVFPGPFYMSTRILLSHDPLQVMEGVVNVHGHLHNSYLARKNYVNVNICQIDYKPLHEKVITNLVNQLEYKRAEFLEE